MKPLWRLPARLWCRIGKGGRLLLIGAVVFLLAWSLFAGQLRQALRPHLVESFRDAVVTGDYPEANVMLWWDPQLVNEPCPSLYGRTVLQLALDEGWADKERYLRSKGATRRPADVRK